MAEKQHTQTRPKDRGFPRKSSPYRLAWLTQSLSRYDRALSFTLQTDLSCPETSLSVEVMR